MGLYARPLQSVDQLLQLVNSIYDAALDENCWPQVIGQLARSFNSDQGIMRVVRPQDDYLACTHNVLSDSEYKNSNFMLILFRHRIFIMAWAVSCMPEIKRNIIYEFTG